MEERNLLRQREWERRNQEAQQQQEQYQENAPLFGEPYKTNKGDELSSRIQRMLGNYEDMKDLHKNFGSVPKDLSASVPFGRPGRPIHSDDSKPPFQNAPLPYRGPVTPAIQSSKKSPATDHTLLSSVYSRSSATLDKGSPELLDGKSEQWPDMASLPPVLPALSPPSDPLSPLHSSDPSDSEQHDLDGKDSPGPRQLLQALSSGPSSAVDTSHAEAQMEGAPLACEAAPLPSQTFPLPLSSKPSLVMPQKPTAYVRPMDGQDQVTSESPELKPSPDFDRPPYESVQDLKSNSKPGLSQLKLPPPALEALSSDAQCVEEILREMTHTWPPLLTAIHTPSTADPPKFSFPNKESQHGHSGYAVQKHEAWRGSSSPPPPPPALSCQPEPPVAPARSSEGETASSSESESSSGSESDSESSESGGEELEEAPPPHIASPPPSAKADGPAVSQWQLSRWLKDPQPSLSVETQGDALHSSPSSPASSPKPREETSTPQHYNPHSSPARPESASPAHYSYNSHSSPVQPETTTPTHYNYNSHSSPVRTEPSTPPHYNYNSHSSPVRSETTTPAHYNYSAHTSPSRPEVKDPEPKPSGQNQHVRSQSPSPPSDVDGGARKTKTKKPSSSGKASRPEDASRHVDNKELASHQKDPSLADRPKVKTKAEPAKAPTKAASKADKKAAKRTDKKKAKEAAPKVTVKLSLPKEAEPDSLTQAPPPPLPLPSVKSRSNNGGGVRSDGPPKPPSSSSSSSSKKKKPRDRSPAQASRPDNDAVGKAGPEAPPRALLVKIQLSLLTRVPKAARPAEPGDKRAERGDAASVAVAAAAAAAAPAKASKKRSAEKEDKSQPRKKLKLDKDTKRSSSPSSVSIAPACPGSNKAEAPKTAAEEKECKKKRKKEKAPSSSTLTAPAAQEPPAKGAGHKRPLADASKASSQTGDGEVKHKKSFSKRSEHTKTGKKSPKSSFAVPEPAQPKRTPASNRVLLKLDDRQYSVEHHMKEAKKLKHKADAMSEKVGKSFIYLEAALSFVESGIAMEMDPQTPKSAYTMFSETVVLIRFILKLRSYSDPASPAPEKDFAILCMRFQSLLQMAMFRYKREAALRYSRTLTDHFKSCKTSPSPRVSKTTSTPSQMSPMASPASSSSSSHSSATAPANTVALPQAIHQVASTYVSITALFLSAHSVWEQAEEMAPKGSGVLLELDSAVGPLTLLSSMSAVVRYTRQGLHWLRQDSQQTH
ncbi:AF4/FMR2 family member 1 isoform X2 [Sardina pilchardus]